MILYLDDEPVNLTLFELMFKSKYGVLLSDSPEKALNLLKEADGIQIVITDMKMPGMNGIEFVKKAKEFKSELPYYLLSGYGMNNEIAEALDCKLINGYLQKPLQREALENIFNQYID